MSDPKSVVETRVVHDMHRMATTLLADAARRPEADPAAVDELRVFLVKTLRHHHETEDDRLWPLIDQVAPGTSGPLESLSAEHEELDHALDRLESAAGDDLAGAAEVVRRTVHEHLAHEEPILFPALRDHVSETTWDDFSAYVFATNPPEGAHLAIGFFGRIATPAELDMMTSGLPEPVKAMAPALIGRAEATFAALGGL